MSNRTVQGALCFQSAYALLRRARRMPFSELVLSRSKQVLWSWFVSVRRWSKQPRVICSSLLWSRVHFHQAWCFQTYPLKKGNYATRRWHIPFPLFILWSSQVFCLGLWSLLCSLVSINRFHWSQQNPRALEVASHQKTRNNLGEILWKSLDTFSTIA